MLTCICSNVASGDTICKITDCRENTKVPKAWWEISHVSLSTQVFSEERWKYLCWGVIRKELICAWIAGFVCLLASSLALFCGTESCKHGTLGFFDNL